MFKPWPIAFICWSCLLVTPSGCSPSGPALGRVSGVVTMDGTPLPRAVVSFTPVAGGRTSEGRTDDTGHYDLIFGPRNYGAMVGHHEVRVSTADVIDMPDGTLRNQKELVPRRYNVDGFLEHEVKRGKNTIDIAVQSGT